MKKLRIGLIAFFLSAGCAGAAMAKDVLANDPDLFAVVTPDRLLHGMTREQWLELYPVEGRVYWDAWACKNKPCDTKEKTHIRATAKLISRPSKSGSAPRPTHVTGG